MQGKQQDHEQDELQELRDEHWEDLWEELQELRDEHWVDLWEQHQQEELRGEHCREDLWEQLQEELRD